jgi:hypothetical protein
MAWARGKDRQRAQTRATNKNLKDRDPPTERQDGSARLGKPAGTHERAGKKSERKYCEKKEEIG